MIIAWALGAVVLLNAYAAILVLLRGLVYRVGVYRPMLWNIFLSFVPVFIAVIALGGLLLFVPAAEIVPVSVAVVALWAYIIVGTLLWLLFFPNSVYLITELNFTHRREGTPVPLWYDIIQTLALTLSGIANAVLSLGLIQTGLTAVILDPTGGGVPTSAWVFAGAVIVLGAVGVYLGRYVRLNSWDARHPVQLVRKLGAHLSSPRRVLEAGAFVLTHALLIALIYVPLYALAYGAAVAGAGSA